MLLKNFAGKPYAGKPHVRIDEGEGSCNLIAPALYSTDTLWYPLGFEFINQNDNETFFNAFALVVLPTENLD